MHTFSDRNINKAIVVVSSVWMRRAWLNGSGMQGRGAYPSFGAGLIDSGIFFSPASMLMMAEVSVSLNDCAAILLSFMTATSVFTSASAFPFHDLKLSPGSFSALADEIKRQWASSCEEQVGRMGSSLCSSSVQLLYSNEGLWYGINTQERHFLQFNLSTSW